MGGRGTDVAREAADLVLLRDDFSALVNTIRYGRRVFANLRKAMAFVLAVHLPIIGLALAPVLMGWPMILMPAHILFLQLVIDPACSIVFEAQALEPGAMRQPPRRSEARLFDGALLRRSALQGVGLLLVALAGHHLAAAWDPSQDMGRTVAFSVLVLGNLGLIQANLAWGAVGVRPGNPAFWWMVAGTLVLLALALGVPAVAQLFKFSPPTWPMLGLSIALAWVAWAWFACISAWEERRGGRA